jgi:exopolysaccharide biosynthesis predicted pyruvyltransferase EpsI
MNGPAIADDTGDDWASIQETIVYVVTASPSGGIVYLPAGVYFLSTELLVAVHDLPGVT